MERRVWGRGGEERVGRGDGEKGLGEGVERRGWGWREGAEEGVERRGWGVEIKGGWSHRLTRVLSY